MGSAFGAFIPEWRGRCVFSYSSMQLGAIKAFVALSLGFKPA